MGLAPSILRRGVAVQSPLAAGLAATDTAQYTVLSANRGPLGLVGARARRRLAMTQF